MADDKQVALVPARVWDGVAEVAEPDLAVVLEGEHIVAIVPVASLAPGMERRELPGCTLIPGLMDAHVHYSAAMGKAFLAAGVTTIRDVGNDLEWILAQRAAHADDMALGPAILCCGHLHDGDPPIWPRMGCANADVAAIKASIRHHAERGVDQIKLYAKLDLERLQAGVDEAHDQGKFVLAHLGGVPAEVAVTTGLNEFEHLDQCAVAWRAASQEEDDAMIDLLLKYDVVIDPTFVVWDRIGRMLDRSFKFDTRRGWVHPCHRDIWDRFHTQYPEASSRLHYQAPMPHLKRFTRRAFERGVTVALGTDTPFIHLFPGFSLHDELAMYVDAGLRPVDALRCATSVNARVFGIEHTAGRIAPGLQADMVLVCGNPLEEIECIGEIEWVLRAGQWFDPNELRTQFEATFDTAPDDPVTRDLLGFVNGDRNK